MKYKTNEAPTEKLKQIKPLRLVPKTSEMAVTKALYEEMRNLAFLMRPAYDTSTVLMMKTLVKAIYDADTI